MIRLAGTIWLTPAEAARRVGRTRRTIQRWIHDGRLAVIAGMIEQSQLLDAERIQRLTNNANRRANLQVASRMS